MKGVVEIESVLRQLPRQDKWEVARWLLENLEETAGANGPTESTAPPRAAKLALPDYAARRRRIFGEKVLPNLVLAAREQERW